MRSDLPGGLFRQGERGVRSNYKKSGHLTKDCRKLKWDLEASTGLLQGFCEGLSLLLTNTSGEIEITIKEEALKALVHTGATLFILNPTQLSCPLPQSKLLHKWWGHPIHQYLFPSR